MAPTKSNKSTPKKTKKESGDEQPMDEIAFGPITYDLSDILVNIKLMNSDEPDVKKKALLAICTAADQSEKLSKHCADQHALYYVAPFIYSSDDLCLRQSMRLITKLITYKNAMINFTLEDWSICQNQLICLFTERDDVVIREYASYILQFTTTECSLAKDFIKPEAIKLIFDSLAEETDPDILYNLLSMVNNIVNLASALICVLEYPDFNITALLCFVQSNNVKFAYVASNILLKIAKWRDERVQQKLLQCEILPIIVKLIMDSTRLVTQQVMLINIVTVFMETKSIAIEFTSTLVFLDFCRFVQTCSSKLLLPISFVFKTISPYKALLQQLYDLSVEDAVVSLLRKKNIDVIYNVCQVLLNFMENQFCCRKITTQVIIHILLDACNDEGVPLDPYKEIIFKTLCKYLTKSTKAIDIVVELGGIKAFANAFENDINKLKRNETSYIFHILYIFATHTKYRLSIMDEKLFRLVIQLFDYKTEDVIYLLNKYISISPYTQLFLELKVPRLIVNKLRITIDEAIHTKLLVLIRNSMMYDEIVLQFLQDGLMPLMQYQRANRKWNYYMIDAIIDNLYNSYLPLKFHDKKRLEITDNIGHKFYMVKESCQESFPFLNILESQHLSPNYTIFVIDVQNPDANENISEENEEEHVEEETVNSTASSNFIKLENNSELSEEVSEMSEHGCYCYKPCFEPYRIGAELEKLTEKKYNMSTCIDSSEESVSPIGIHVCPGVNIHEGICNYPTSSTMDMATIVKNVELELNSQICSCIANKYKIIAKYIHKHFTVEYNAGVNEFYLYKMNMELLKQRLQSSIIPLELVQSGTYCERALLFKFLCDAFGLPATLVRGNKMIFYNEVPIVSAASNVINEKERDISYSVIDLMINIGNLMEVGEIEANIYCFITSL